MLDCNSVEEKCWIWILKSYDEIRVLVCFWRDVLLEMEDFIKIIFYGL